MSPDQRLRGKDAARDSADRLVTKLRRRIDRLEEANLVLVEQFSQRAPIAKTAHCLESPVVAIARRWRDVLISRVQFALVAS